jgi:RNA polymerase sigma factor (TIGR02999 family)
MISQRTREVSGSKSGRNFFGINSIRPLEWSLNCRLSRLLKASCLPDRQPLVPRISRSGSPGRVWNFGAFAGRRAGVKLVASRTSSLNPEWIPRRNGARDRAGDATGSRRVAVSMNDVTHILSAIEQGDALAAEQLLPLVYDELRRLAVQKLAQEKPGQTLQATALVHEAYLRLVDSDQIQRWDSKGHFFAAAAEAMRRILVDETRRKRSLKRGGMLARQDLNDARLTTPVGELDVLALDEALARLAARDAEAAELVKLRFFAGMTMREAAQAMGLPQRTAERIWTYARSFLLKEMRSESQ